MPAALATNADPLVAIGYVRSTRDRAELARHAGAIRRACTGRGWKLAELVRDDQTNRGRTLERPGLAAAMERLAGPGSSRLVVSKLAHLSRSATDLRALFEWFSRNDVQVIATDVGIDTTTAEGRRAAHAVLAKVVERQAQARATGNGHNGVVHANGKGTTPAVANGNGNGTAHAVANGNGTAHAVANGNGTAHAAANGNGTTHVIANGNGNGTGHAVANGNGAAHNGNGASHNGNGASHNGNGAAHNGNHNGTHREAAVEVTAGAEPSKQSAER
ncbi:MAG TPA: recombinase family protein [Thermoleophilaceae bacterium]|nr:recombinase family protein [Thermoleophilaceae bacterium]